MVLQAFKRLANAGFSSVYYKNPFLILIKSRKIIYVAGNTHQGTLGISDNESLGILG
jgi:hypothetical protein